MLIEDTIFTRSYLLLETGIPFYLVIGATRRQCKEAPSFFVIFKTLSIGQAPGIPILDILQSSAPMTDLFYPARFAILKSAGAAWQGSPSAGPVAILANYKFKSSAVLLNTI